MTLDAMLNMTMTIHRPSVTYGELREEIRGYTLIASDVPCSAQRPQAILGSTGPGLTDQGGRTVYCEAAVDVQDLDVLTITGPDGVQMFEVDGAPTKPWGDHTEIPCRFFHGQLTPVQGGS